MAKNVIIVLQGSKRSHQWNALQWSWSQLSLELIEAWMPEYRKLLKKKSINSRVYEKYMKKKYTLPLTCYNHCPWYIPKKGKLIYHWMLTTTTCKQLLKSSTEQHPIITRNMPIKLPQFIKQYSPMNPAVEEWTVYNIKVNITNVNLQIIQ